MVGWNKTAVRFSNASGRSGYKLKMASYLWPRTSYPLLITSFLSSANSYRFSEFIRNFDILCNSFYIVDRLLAQYQVQNNIISFVRKMFFLEISKQQKFLLIKRSIIL
jgi:hypothetical protein